MSYFKKTNILTFLFCLSFTLFSANIWAQAYTVTDVEGRSVSLRKPAKRIISLAPHITENAFTVGLGDKIVGVVAYSDFPLAAQKITNVGNYTSLNIEAIVALKPDLILAWRSGNKRESLNKLMRLGYPVYIGEPHTIEDIAKSLEDMAILGGMKDQGELQARLFLNTMYDLKRRYSMRQSITTFYQVWHKPLQTLNGNSLISDVISLCGGINIFAQEEITAPVVSVEAILARNPDVILASGMGESRPEWLDQWRRFTSLKAVKKEQLFHIHPDILQRHTVRIAQGATQLCAQLDSVRQKKHSEGAN